MNVQNYQELPWESEASRIAPRVSYLTITKEAFHTESLFRDYITKKDCWIKGLCTQMNYLYSNNIRKIWIRINFANSSSVQGYLWDIYSDPINSSNSWIKLEDQYWTAWNAYRYDDYTSITISKEGIKKLFGVSMRQTNEYVALINSLYSLEQSRNYFKSVNANVTLENELPIHDREESLNDFKIIKRRKTRRNNIPALNPSTNYLSSPTHNQPHRTTTTQTQTTSPNNILGEADRQKEATAAFLSNYDKTFEEGDGRRIQPNPPPPITQTQTIIPTQTIDTPDIYDYLFEEAPQNSRVNYRRPKITNADIKKELAEKLQLKSELTQQDTNARNIRAQNQALARSEADNARLRQLLPGLEQGQKDYRRQIRALTKKQQEDINVINDLKDSIVDLLGEINNGNSTSYNLNMLASQNVKYEKSLDDYRQEYREEPPDQ